MPRKGSNEKFIRRMWPGMSVLALTCILNDCERMEKAMAEGKRNAYRRKLPDGWRKIHPGPQSRKSL